MFTGLLALIGVIPAALHTVDGIANAIANEKIALINATTEQERIQIQERISALQSRQAILIADAGTPSGIWNARMRFFISIGPAWILFKFLFWDKGIGPFFGCVGKNTPDYCKIFITDPLDDHMWYAVTAVIIFYLAADAYKSKK